MKALSLKLKEGIFVEVEKIIHELHKPRNTYINEALAFYNKMAQRKLIKKRLHVESKEAAIDSLAILEEFEKMGESLPE